MSTSFNYARTIANGALASWDAVFGINARTDPSLEFNSDTSAAFIFQGAAALPYLNTGIEPGGTERIIQQGRGARIFTGPVAATASGNTTVWTPSGGTRWILLAATITVAATLGAAAALNIAFNEEGGATFWGAAVVVPATFAFGTVIPVDFGHGRAAASVDTDLRINLSAAVTAGSVTVSVWGIETT
jgi:hypothetical protein